MPTYDYTCPSGHTTERRAGYDVTSIRCECGKAAAREAVYVDQEIICETGRVIGARDRVRRDHAGEKLNKIRKSSVEAYRESGKQSGPMEIKDWMR